MAPGALTNIEIVDLIKYIVMARGYLQQDARCLVLFDTVMIGDMTSTYIRLWIFTHCGNILDFQYKKEVGKGQRHIL